MALAPKHAHALLDNHVMALFQYSVVTQLGPTQRTSSDRRGVGPLVQGPPRRAKHERFQAEKPGALIIQGGYNKSPDVAFLDVLEFQGWKLPRLVQSRQEFVCFPAREQHDCTRKSGQ